MNSSPGAQATTIQAPPPAPATETSLEVIQAKAAARMQAKARTGVNSTILAEKMGAAPQLAAATPGKTTLLGGG